MLRANDSLPADSLPMDVNPATRKVLFSSYSAGLGEVERHGIEDWHVRDLSQGRTQLPLGQFRDAQFTRDGGLAPVLYSKRLLLVNDKATLMFTPKQGVYTTNLFHNVALPAVAL